jgi:hypothetical protein
MDCVKDDMKIKGVSMGMTSDRREWKKKTCCADHDDQGTMMMTLYHSCFKDISANIEL